MPKILLVGDVGGQIQVFFLHNTTIYYRSSLVTKVLHRSRSSSIEDNYNHS